MNIWVEGREYSLGMMPNKVLSLYLRKYIKVDWENTWLPETNKRESYAVLNEAARRLMQMKERPMTDNSTLEREIGEEREYGVMYDDGTASCLHCSELDYTFLEPIMNDTSKIVRRKVGKWEEVVDG